MCKSCVTYLLTYLQSVIQVAACLVMRKRKFDLISNDIRDRLHWLPVKQRIDFKLALLVYKCLHGEALSYLAEMLELRSDNPSTEKHSESWTGKTHSSLFEAEDVWTTKLRHDWAIPLEQSANWSHWRDTQHFNLQEQTQNIFIQTVFPGRIETLYRLHERLCDGLAIKKRYINVLYIAIISKLSSLPTPIPDRTYTGPTLELLSPVTLNSCQIFSSWLCANITYQIMLRGFLHTHRQTGKPLIFKWNLSCFFQTCPCYTNS